MFSCEQDRTAAARTEFTSRAPRPARSSPRRVGPATVSIHQVLPAAAAVQPQRAKNKKHGAWRSSSSSSSRRSSTAVVATDVNNFRAMVQELTGFPPAAIFRPLPRRVHAASPFVAGGGAGQGCSGSERHGHGGSEATNNCTYCRRRRRHHSRRSAVLQPPPQCAPVLGVFDGLTDLGSPEFDSWGNLSFE